MNITYNEFENSIPEKWLNLIDKNKLKYAYDRLKDEEEIKPSIENIFNCFKYFNPDEIKVVILAQDPYPTQNVADGLAFSCSEYTKKIPKTLNNIINQILIQYNRYDLLEDKLDINKFNINLEYLAKQKILLLNTLLTVGDSPMSHKHIWESISNNIIKKNIRN